MGPGANPFNRIREHHGFTMLRPTYLQRARVAGREDGVNDGLELPEGLDVVARPRGVDHGQVHEGPAQPVAPREHVVVPAQSKASRNLSLQSRIGEAWIG